MRSGLFLPSTDAGGENQHRHDRRQHQTGRGVWLPPSPPNVRDSGVADKMEPHQFHGWIDDSASLIGAVSAAASMASVNLGRFQSEPKW